MTTQDLINYYAGLLIMQYRTKPRAYGTMQAVVTPFIQDQLALALKDAFNIDTAVGTQLDTLGKYAGVERRVLTFSGSSTLNDTDYRLLIKMKLVQNNSGSSLEEIQALLNRFFPGTMQVFDYEGMRMDYFLSSSFGSLVLAQAFIREGLLPKPMGVQLGALLYVPDINNWFAMRSYSIDLFNSSGMNDYTTYHMDRHWLSYTDGISF